LLFQEPDGALAGAAHAWIELGREVLTRQADDEALERFRHGGQPQRIAIFTRRVARIAAADDRQDARGVVHAAPEYADLIERRPERHQTVAGHAAIGGDRKSTRLNSSHALLS